MHLNEMVGALDKEVSRLMGIQIMESEDPRFGGFRLPNHHVEPRHSGFGFSRMALAYACMESSHYLSPSVAKAIEAVIVYMERVQRPDGCFDLSGCNFASPPDTAFMMNAVLNAWWVIEKRNVPETLWIKEPIYRLIDSAASGIAAGGFHTPNHRWAIASCLLSCAKITGRKELADRANQYLNEGLDINEDGEFAERSAGNYNQVNDDQMIRLYFATGETRFLEAAKQNLEMMYCYIDPDESVFTNNSTRQDYGRKVYTETYYEYFLMAGYFLKCKELGAMAEWIYQSAKRHGKTVPGVEWLLLYPEMDGYGADAEFAKPFTHYNRLFKESKIARVRSGNFSYTVMEDKANFLYFQVGAFAMYMVIYSNLCDKRNFVPQSMEKIEGGYRLKAHAEGWYYLPYYPDKPDTSDWWAMDNPNTRPKIQGLPLDTTVDIIEQANGIDVRFRTEGIDRLPFRVELGFLPGCEMRTDSMILSGKAGESITLLKGEAELKAPTGETITISDAFGRHNALMRSGGAYPQSNDHFTVYLTDYTPVDRVLKIRTTCLKPLI